MVWRATSEGVACLTNRFTRSLLARSIEGCQEGYRRAWSVGDEIVWVYTICSVV
jgi:hypothetical protein